MNCYFKKAFFFAPGLQRAVGFKHKNPPHPPTHPPLNVSKQLELKRHMTGVISF